jgi:hypothetical protein
MTCVVLWAALPAALALAANPPAAPTNADCMTCHEDGVPPPAFDASVHGQAGLACVDCHADLARTTEFPHPEKLAKVDCVSCHGEAASQYAAGVHGEARQKEPGGLAAACTDCHGPAHEIRPSKDPLSATYHFNLPKTCGRCHGDPETIRRGHIEAGNVPASFADSIHGKALSQSGLVVAPHCATCHGHHDIRRKEDAASRVFRGNVPGTCGSCHAGIKARYDESVHAAAVHAGQRGAVCSDCHTAHEIRPADLPAWRLDVIRECGTCHEESRRTYRDGFHGQASALGFTRVAACADCHGAHEILPKSDPRSKVAPANLVATCGKCHPGANARFVKFDPHADPEAPQRSAPVHYTARFMRLLLAAVFAFFGVHTLLWFPRELRALRQLRKHGPAADEGKADGD